MTYDSDHDDDVTVEREGTGIGTILGIILAVIVVLAIVWFFFLNGTAPATPNSGTDINQDTTVQGDPPGAQPNGGETEF